MCDSSSIPKILIVGLSKSGTTALTFNIAKQLEYAKVNFEPNTLKGLSEFKIHENLTDNKQQAIITKCLFFSRQEIVLDKIERLYNKKIWLIRDPRDRLISAFLYRWFHTHNRDTNQFAATLKTVIAKEKNPSQISFHKIIECSFDLNVFLKEEQRIYESLINQIKNLSQDWLIVKYEDLIQHQILSLNNYLNLNLSKLTSKNKTLKRVKRTSNLGNWKNWFTKEDAILFEPIYKNFFEYFDYDNDWTLNKNQIINKKEGSKYLKKINKPPNILMELTTFLENKLKKS